MAPKTILSNEDLGKKIKVRRNELRLTIEEAASRAGVGVKTWCRYESGGSIRKDKCKGICKALNWRSFPDNAGSEPGKNLIEEYKTALANAPETSDDKEVKTKSYYQSQIDWLNERFPDGKYNDVIGLCKVAKLEGEDGIIDQDYSLNAGRYVGVVIEDDGMTAEEFKAEMLSLNEELLKLNDEAHSLEQTIAKNLKELFK